ncbi:helix-turn-helix transcriptional regulator [bacterium]|nr:helix-turn-helix transcriptional regulator [bacterium]
MNNKSDTITYKLGKKIKIERIKRDISQEQLAELAGVGTNTISGIERGVQSPTVETVGAIAKALDIELYKLFIFDI